MKKTGFSLVEALIGLGVLSIVFMGIAALQTAQESARAKENLGAILSAKKAYLTNLVTSDASWQKTVSNASASSHLGCLASAAGCVGVSQNSDFDLYDASGELAFSSSPGSGYNIYGNVCDSQPSLGSTLKLAVPCTVLLRLEWKPSCAPPALDPKCKSPLIQVTGTFSAASSSKVNLNLQKFSFQINRSSLSTSTCAGSAPACPGKVAVCTSTGWFCWKRQTGRCKGAVSWNDESTGFGPCAGTISPPGILHDTMVNGVNNTVGNQSGSASFVCHPGGANNGFTALPGATCSAAPIAGQCGKANGGTFADATAATAAGLCSTGTPSTSLAGAGPWSWTCSGQNGGAASPTCNADVPASVTGYCSAGGLGAAPSGPFNGFSLAGGGYVTVSTAAGVCGWNSHWVPPTGVSCSISGPVSCTSPGPFATAYSISFPMSCSDGKTITQTEYGNSCTATYTKVATPADSCPAIHAPSLTCSGTVFTISTDPAIPWPVASLCSRPAFDQHWYCVGGGAGIGYVSTSTGICRNGTATVLGCAGNTLTCRCD